MINCSRRGTHRETRHVRLWRTLGRLHPEGGGCQNRRGRTEIGPVAGGLDEQRFLDIGSVSGLHSLAALHLGLARWLRWI